MMFYGLVLTLAVVCQTYAYTAPTLKCSSGTNIQNLSGQLDDTFKAGTILFYTEEKLKMPSTQDSCHGNILFNLTNRTNGTNGTVVSLKIPLVTYCEESINCNFVCDTKSQEGFTLRSKIKRTMEYNLSFIEPNYSAHVKENTENGIQIKLKTGLSVNVQNCAGATNFPTPHFSRRYGLSENTSKPFKWDAETSNDSLRLNGLVDFEKERMYELTLKAWLADNGGQKLRGTATTTLTVVVDDVDDNNPRFNISQTEMYKLSIPENNSSYVNTSLSTTPAVHAYDPDFGINMNISYSIIDQQIPIPFNISTKTGRIIVTEELDYEKQHTYTVYIKAAQDDKPNIATAQARIDVNVIDIDDHIPEFTSNNYTCGVGEHSVVGTVVCSVTAIDMDGTEKNSNFTYILWGQILPLSINKEGHIMVEDSIKFDRESLGDEITFEVGSKSSGSQMYGGNATVTIQLIDMNDNNPKFQQDDYSFNVGNITIGFIIGQVNATDADVGNNSEITYNVLSSIPSSCVGNSPQTAVFSVDSITGEINVTDALICKQYELHIQACDNGLNKRCSLTVVNIALTSAPDVQHITQHVSILEGLPNGTAVDIVKCSGIQPGYTYAVGSEFEVDNSTGMLKTMRVFDRETNNSFKFEVNVTNDSGMLLCIVSFIVSVEDVNDNSPQFPNVPYKFTLATNPKDGDFLGNIVATDTDIDENGNISYCLKNRRNSPFELDKYSGNLTVNQSDRLNEDIMQVFVTAVDNGIPPRKASTVVYVISQTTGNMVPISTPLTKEQVENMKKEYSREISKILGITVEISHVEKMQNDTSQYKSRVHITADQNSAASKQYFLSQVLNHYEDIRSLFYQSSENTGTNNKSEPAIGPSEIGLIVMAGVILAGAILAIFIVHRQFNNHKRYKQLYETLTKNSSLYESQEITVDIDDDGPDCNGTVHSRDLNDEDSPSLAVGAVNPVYQSDTTVTPSTEEIQTLDDTSTDSQHEHTNVKEVLQQLSESYEKEENVSEKIENENNEEQGETVVYANVLNDTERNRNYENVVYAPNEIPSEQEEGSSTDSNNNNDLMTFDSESNGEANGQWNDETELKSPENEITEEPQPDYNEKQVRFHSEVLDADENKLEPLKVKNEEETELKDSSNTGVNTVVDEPFKEGDADGIPAQDPDLDVAENEDGIESTEDDTDRLEEEISSPEVNVAYQDQIQNEFYYGSKQSTHF